MLMMDTKITIITTVIGLIVPNNGDKNTGGYNSSFEKVVDNWSNFVDKTLFIKALFEKETPTMILVRAPDGHGKSTNMDMVKRFLEISFHNQSNQVDVKKLPNYSLFANLNRLKICKHQKLFADHFGKYPVLLIDYKPLCDNTITTNFDSFLTRVSTVVRNSFTHHAYLLKSSKLWSTTHNTGITQVQFNKFVGQREPYKNTELSETDIKNGFTLLAQLLFKEFGKPVFVLIDDFDTYTDNLDFSGNMDADRIVAFIQSVTGELLKSNCVGRALLMSTHHQVNNNRNSYCHVNNSAINNITEYKFLDHHSFNEYHGISESEMKILLERTVGDPDEIILTKDLINEHVASHIVQKDNIKLYRTFPVVNFLRHRLRTGFRLIRSDF